MSRYNILFTQYVHVWQFNITRVGTKRQQNKPIPMDSQRQKLTEEFSGSTLPHAFMCNPTSRHLITLSVITELLSLGTLLILGRSLWLEDHAVAGFAIALLLNAAGLVGAG